MLDRDTLLNNNSELFEYLSALLDNELDDFLSAVPHDRAIRLNRLKTQPQKLLNTFGKDLQLQKLVYSDDGYKIIDEKISLSHSLEFFKGYFSFQGASSQIPPLVLNPGPGEKVLDMAASPGSKTTQMGIMMQNKGQLIVNDSNLNRMQALNTNTQKTGLINHQIYYLAGERIGRLFPEHFDKVLLDTPCSGLGTLADHPEVISWWSNEKLQKLTRLQKQLIVSAIKATRVGGEIVYSTCSVAPEENEMIIQDVLQNYPLEILAAENKGLQAFDDGLTQYKNKKLHPSMKYCRRVWPHKHNMEGFFVARLRKTAEYYNKNNPKKVHRFKTLSSSDETLQADLQAISGSWGIDSASWKDFRFIKTSDRIWMLNDEIREVIQDGFTNGGMLLAEKRLHIWKLSHQSVQFFSDKISKRKMVLTPLQTSELFLNGSTACDDSFRGYYALVINDQPSAIVYVEKGEVKIKLSHPFKIPSL